MIAATRLRKGSTSSARGAASFVAATLGHREAVRRGRGWWWPGWTRRSTPPTWSPHRPGRRRFSITARLNASVRAAIAAIDEDAWTPIHYPNAVWDDQAGGWISDAEVAETTYTAFTSRGRAGR